MTNRDNRGRFIPGNTIAYAGWAGLVTKRFSGDEHTARLWVAQVGRWAYARQFEGHRTSLMAMRAQTAFAHPGAPEQYRQRFDFSLADVQPMEF